MSVITLQSLTDIIGKLSGRIRRLEVSHSGGAFIQAGVAADRPATPTNQSGKAMIYFATDTGVLSVWNGSAWKTSTLS